MYVWKIISHCYRLQSKDILVKESVFFTGVGMSANQMYREDGTPCSEHEYEDRSIHFCLDRENNTYLYGVFDGHDGAKAAYFASQVEYYFFLVKNSSLYHGFLLQWNIGS